MLAKFRIRVRMLILRAATRLQFISIKCPYCGGENWPEYETAKQYHCKNCARRWNKVDGSIARYRVHRDNF